MTHCKENPIYLFLFWELRGLSPNFHIHVSVSDLYVLRFAPMRGIYLHKIRLTLNKIKKSYLQDGYFCESRNNFHVVVSGRYTF
jgi:hypothetical protein